MDLIQTKRITDRLYLLYEDLTPGAPFVMTLVIGDQKAALIDTGYGASGDLDQVVRRLTDKPVVCLLTHADPDHAGGAALFDEIWLHPADQPLLDRGSVRASTRRMIAQGLAGPNKALARQVGRSIVRANGFTYRALVEGQVIDLGGQSLEVVAFPGHSPGSVCFWNQAENYLVAGDAIANAGSAVLFFDKCLPLRTYYDHLVRFSRRFGVGTTIYTGHDLEPLAPRIIPELLTLCEEIFAGDTAADTPYLPPFLRFDPRGAGWLERLIKPRILALVARKELGDSLPLEHKRPGFRATIKYNARKIGSGELMPHDVPSPPKASQGFQYLFRRPGAPDPQTMLDKFSIVELIEFERFCRDNARWEEMKECFTPDSRVVISWFQGTGEAFVEASKGMTNPAPHKLYNTVVWIHGDRAVSLTMCAITTRLVLEGREVDLASEAKLLYRTQRVGGRWMIAGFEGIYERDSLVPASPTDGLVVPPEALASFRPSYSRLAYALSGRGYPIANDLPGLDRPELVDRAYRDAEAWLAQA